MVLGWDGRYWAGSGGSLDDLQSNRVHHVVLARSQPVFEFPEVLALLRELHVAPNRAASERFTAGPATEGDAMLRRRERMSTKSVLEPLLPVDLDRETARAPIEVEVKDRAIAPVDSR